MNRKLINNMNPGDIMLVVKNDNGTFSPLGMNNQQGYFLNKCISVLTNDEPFVKEDTELIIKSDEKERDNRNGND